LWCCGHEFWHHHPRLGNWPQHCVQTLAFRTISYSYQAHIFNAIVGVNQLVCKDNFKASIRQMKAQYSIVVDMFIIELDKQFVHFELINP
jgi:hypothetical protein